MKRSNKHTYTLNYPNPIIITNMSIYCPDSSATVDIRLGKMYIAKNIRIPHMALVCFGPYHLEPNAKFKIISNKKVVVSHNLCILQ